MIDTDKYEGHTPAPWDKLSEYCPVGSIDKQLIADAPLLLESYKRLREEVSSVIRGMLSDSEENASWGATVHAYIKYLQKVIE